MRLFIEIVYYGLLLWYSVSGGNDMQPLENTGKLVIARAEEADFADIRVFYHAVIDGFRDLSVHPYWEKDVYPSPEQLKDLIGKGELYAGLINGEIVSAMALNHSCHESYRSFDWPSRLTDDELYVIHMLGVVSRWSRMGFAKKMVKFAEQKARADGLKALRLDVLKENTPAINLYESLGFRRMHTLQMYYVDCGWKDFMLYELLLFQQ